MGRVGPAPVELVADCSACGLEGGVVEIYDALVAACRFGLAATARCKLCGSAHEGRFDREPARPMRDVPANRCPACLELLGPSALDERRCGACGATASSVELSPPASLASEAALGAALDAWAEREKWGSRQALLDAVFCEPSVDRILTRIARREPIEIVADPFANMGVKTTGRAAPASASSSRGPKAPLVRSAHEPPPLPSPSAGGAFALRANAGDVQATSASASASASASSLPSAPAVKVTPERVTVNPPSNPLKLKTPTQDFRADITAPDPLGAFTTAPTDPLAPPLRPSVPTTTAPVSPAVAAAMATGAATPFAPPAAAAAAMVTGAATPFAPSPSAPSEVPVPASAPPRAIVYPLVSVVAADGEIHPAERALVDRFLVSEGLTPLTDEEFRVHHPSEVAHLVPKDRREAVVQLMCESATVDGMPDESERRVIRAYAVAWGVPDEKVEFWMWGYESMGTSLARQLWMKLRRFVLSARWSDAGTEHR